MLEDAANNTATLGAGLTTGAIAKAIADKTDAGAKINSFMRNKGKDLLYAPGYLLDKYMLGGSLSEKGKPTAVNIRRGESALKALKPLATNPKTRAVLATLFGTTYGGAMLGNHMFHHYADRY